MHQIDAFDCWGHVLHLLQHLTRALHFYNAVSSSKKCNFWKTKTLSVWMAPKILKVWKNTIFKHKSRAVSDSVSLTMTVCKKTMRLPCVSVCGSLLPFYSQTLVPWEAPSMLLSHPACHSSTCNRHYFCMTVDVGHTHTTPPTHLYLTPIDGSCRGWVR